MNEMSEPAEFMRQMVEENRPAFDLWKRVCCPLEEAVIRPRNIQPAFSRALDLLFIQAFKSFSSLYVLCVRGLGEDAATILRRLLEVSIQAVFLAQDADAKERENRGKRYLAYFWAQVPDLLKCHLDPARRQWWENMFDLHKGLLSFDRRGKPNNWWGGRSVRDLFKKVNREDTYEQDYTLLCQMAHGTSQGILLDTRGGRIEIVSSRMVREILVFGCRYVLPVAHLWNECFNLMDRGMIDTLLQEALAFDFHDRGKV